jgi:hypothetical protein
VGCSRRCARPGGCAQREQPEAEEGPASGLRSGSAGSQAQRAQHGPRTCCRCRRLFSLPSSCRRYLGTLHSHSRCIYSWISLEIIKYRRALSLRFCALWNHRNVTEGGCHSFLVGSHADLVVVKVLLIADAAGLGDMDSDDGEYALLMSRKPFGRSMGQSMAPTRQAGDAGEFHGCCLSFYMFVMSPVSGIHLLRS